MSTIVLRSIVLLLCAVLFNAAIAAETIVIAPSIPFSKTRSVGTLDQEDCAWNERLVSEIVRQSKGRVVISEGAPAAVNGQQLQIEVVDVFAPGGGNWSGDKWITIRGNLVEGGTRVAGFDFSEKGGGLTTCRALTSIAGDLADDVNEWLKKPLPECAPSCFTRPASEVIMIAAEIPYASAEAVAEDVRKECDWNRQSVDTLVQLSNGALAVSSEDLSNYKGKKLVVKTIEVHAAGGSTFFGPKWISVRGELFDQDKIIGSFHSQQRTVNGTFESCATLRSLGRHLAVEVSEWLDDPRLDSKL